MAYVESMIGPFRLDVITYRGGTLHHVADLLERCYAHVTAVADCDTDGVFPIPELVHLMRSLGELDFEPWADPARRRRRRPTAKRYFKVHWTSEIGPGDAFHEFDGETPTRQAERYGDRWFSSRDEYHPELGPGLALLPLSEFDLHPKSDDVSVEEITAEEFETAWLTAGAYRQT